MILKRQQRNGENNIRNDISAQEGDNSLPSAMATTLEVEASRR